MTLPDVQHDRPEQHQTAELAAPEAAALTVAAGEVQRHQQALGNQTLQRLARQAALPPGLLLRHQQTQGNRAVQRLLRTGAIQAKLTVSSPDDAFEQEAEETARQVMTMPARPRAGGVAVQLARRLGVQRLCPQCEAEQERAVASGAAVDVQRLCPTCAANLPQAGAADEPLMQHAADEESAATGATPGGGPLARATDQELAEMPGGGLLAQADDEMLATSAETPGGGLMAAEDERAVGPGGGLVARSVADEQGTGPGGGLLARAADEEMAEAPGGGLLAQAEDEELASAPGGGLMASAEGELSVSDDLASRITGMQGGGQPLPDQERGFFEERFDQDFSQVRVHTDGEAADTAHSVNAQAYTVGQDIVFGAGQYEPGTDSGRHLLAHELTHTIQQGGPRPRGGQVQRTIGDGHDLTSPRFSGDTVLEAVFDNERMLRSGDRGPAVEKVQQALIDLGFPLPRFGVDGIFGGETRDAVKAFQRSAGVGDDGVIGPLTMTQLDTRSGGGAPTPPPTPPGPTPPGPTPPGPTPPGPTPPGPTPPGPTPPGPTPPGPTPPVAPQLTANITTGPTPGNSGQVNFVVTWGLSANAGATGGFVIQDVTFNWSVLDCTGTPVPNADPRTSPLRYFEAWRVDPNSTNMTPVSTDTFFWPGAPPWAGPTTRGAVSITASARYHDNVASLPNSMVANNPATFAGGLQSSTTDPAVTGTISNTVPHLLMWSWDTCPPNATTSQTVVLAHTP